MSRRKQLQRQLDQVRKADEEHALMIGGKATNTTLYPRCQLGSRTRAREWPEHLRYVVDSHSGTVEFSSTERGCRETAV